MSLADTVPKGCIGCNRKEVAPVLEAAGMSLDRFKEVPKPRHNWGDVSVCPECDRAWLILPQTTVRGNDAK